MKGFVSECGYQRRRFSGDDGGLWNITVKEDAFEGKWLSGKMVVRESDG